MTQHDTAPISFTQPFRQVIAMLIACGLVTGGVWFIKLQVLHILQTNPYLNAFIIGVFTLGILTCFWQVLTLIQSVRWIENFANDVPGTDDAHPPRLLAPLAALLRSRESKRQITSANAHSILDSVATRIDEARDITRYLTNLLIFLGLLGTFYGLATTIPAIVETIKNLAPQAGETGVEIFSKLMAGLQEQLGGMSTAFSSSLMGLAGSLVVGLLELFASHGQNRFYRELEEWVSSITRLGFAGGEGETADQGVLVQLLDHMAGQIEVLQAIYSQAEANRAQSEDKVGELAAAIRRLSKGMEAEKGQVAALDRIAAGQEKILAALTTTEGGAQGYTDAESRMRLRSIDVQLLRILEEISAGRQESIADLRGDLTALTTAIRALSRGTVGRG
ncbi:biopolymer transporter ExbB [bacterium]|nr:biopolymer transporter ExbB [bacterium]